MKPIYSKTVYAKRIIQNIINFFYKFARSYKNVVLFSEGV